MRRSPRLEGEAVVAAVAEDEGEDVAEDVLSLLPKRRRFLTNLASSATTVKNLGILRMNAVV